LFGGASLNGYSASSSFSAPRHGWGYIPPILDSSAFLRCCPSFPTVPFSASLRLWLCIRFLVRDCYLRGILCLCCLRTKSFPFFRSGAGGLPDLVWGFVLSRPRSGFPRQSSLFPLYGSRYRCLTCTPSAPRIERFSFELPFSSGIYSSVWEFRFL